MKKFMPVLFVSLVVSLAVLLSPAFSFATQIILNPGQTSYEIRALEKTPIQIIRTQNSPKNINIDVHTVMTNQCTKWDAQNMCGYDEYQCGRDCYYVPGGHHNHGYYVCRARYCCWTMRICTETKEVAVESKSRLIEINFDTPVAAGDTESYNLTYTKKQNNFLFAHWNIRRFFSLEQTLGANQHVITKTEGDGKSKEWSFDVK